MIIQYFKKRNSSLRKGVMVALPVEQEGVVKFGYSLCRSALDKFDKKRGLDIAINRARCNRPLNIPDSMKEKFDNFKKRCNKYYKQLEVYSPGYIPGN
jgi:hypothetical protein